VRGIDAVVPDSLLVTRAREALALGALDAVTLMERVCSLPGAPAAVAERLAGALFSRHADFQRGADGRWFIAGERGVRRATRIGVPVAPEPPPVTVRERRRASARSEDDVLLQELRFAVVDVETTGTAPGRQDRVTEIAIVHVDGHTVSECYESLVNPERAIPPQIIALTRITQEMVQAAPRFPQVASDVVARLRERVFVAHNASFDWRFVSHEVQRAAGVMLTGETLCTVRLARALLPQLPRRSLDAVTHYFGIDIGARHRAAGDAIATAHVLVRLLQLAEEHGATTWGGLGTLLQGKTARAARRRSAMPRWVDVDPTL
jgi:DNA polymerase-3 subunit epsilon